MSKNDTGSEVISGGTIHRTIRLLQRALIQLEVKIENKIIEKIGIMVHRAMNMQNRSFHTPEHIFDLADPENPHITLAAIFHDVVYFQVDEGFQAEIGKVLEPYVFITDGTISIRDVIDKADRAFYGTAAIFGFTPGQILSPFAGLNEFLSALLMNCLLEGKVKDVDLLIATSAIEMTIPFRGPDDEGYSPTVLLEKRIVRTNESFGLNLDDEEIKNAVVSAVVLSNRDIRNFAEDEPGRFLDNTWKLLPETNPELFFHGLYTIKSYSTAIRKMEGFLCQLNPENVFQQFAGYPEQSEYENLLRKTTDNLWTARKYLGIKMISSGILQALADHSGGDAPMSFFMGDIHTEDEKSSLAHYLPEIPACDGEDKKKEEVLYRLLKYGRSESSDFDLQNSPLSLFIFCCLDDERLEKSINVSRKFLKGEISGNEYLGIIPSFVVGSIANAASYIAFTRKKKLLEISGNYLG